MRRGPTACLTTFLLALAAWPSSSRAQVFLGEVPQYELSGSALVSYLGSWQGVGDRLTGTHQLSEGLNLSLSGWIYESRFVKFRSYLLVLRLDTFGPSRGKAYSLGYGGSLSLLSGSILPVTLAFGQGLAVAGSTLAPVGVTSATTIQGFAQLVSPVLPRAEVRGEHATLDDGGGGRTTNDAVVGSVYGGSELNRYAAVASWRGEQFTGLPRTTTTLASISDTATLSRDTRATFDASLSRSEGLGGIPTDTFTSYAAGGALFTRFTSRALLRGQYGYSSDVAPDRQQSANQASGGATIDLKPIPILLGEGVAATNTRYLAPGLDRTVEAISGSQGVATQGRWGSLTGTLAGYGQLGYSDVSDGKSGPLRGYGGNAGLQLALPRSPIRASAFYIEREDHSSAGNSLRSYGGLVSSDVGVYYPLFLLPVVSYTHVAQNAFFAPPPEVAPGPPGSVPATTFTESDTFTASVTGTSPLYGTRLTFVGGYVDSSSQLQSSRLKEIYGRVADLFRLGPGTFGNLSINASHQLGQGWNAAALASLVWAFRESSLSATYAYGIALPQGSSTHTVTFLFTRTFETAFLPESR
jgi:hypothetical protein